MWPAIWKPKFVSLEFNFFYNTKQIFIIASPHYDTVFSAKMTTITAWNNNVYCNNYLKASETANNNSKNSSIKQSFQTN